MPTLPLYTPISADADTACSRRVIAPGGYEWWRVDALDPERQLLLVVEFFSGDPADEAYLRAFDRYLRRPTVHPPPSPGHFAGFAATVYRGEQVVAAVMQSRQAFDAAPDRLDVRIGPSRLQRRDDGSIDLSTGPVHLVLRPRHALPARTFSSDRHHCVAFAPLHDAEGSIAAGGERIALKGAAWGHYLFGTAPLRRTVRQWEFARALAHDQAQMKISFELDGVETSWSARATAAGWDKGSVLAVPNPAGLTTLPARAAMRRSCTFNPCLVVDQLST